MNARYHATREAFLDRVHRWLMFGVIVLGTGTVASFASKLGPRDWLDLGFGAGAAILGALDLTFDLSNRARAHSLMKRRYFELLGDVKSERMPLSEAEACLHRYSADEEPAYHALIAGAWNAAQQMVYGDGADQYQIPRSHRLLQNLWRFDGAKSYDIVRGQRTPHVA